MASLHKTIQQQKNDISRYKEKAEQAEQKLTKVRMYFCLLSFLPGITAHNVKTRVCACMCACVEFVCVCMHVCVRACVHAFTKFPDAHALTHTVTGTHKEACVYANNMHTHKEACRQGLNGYIHMH